MSNSYTTVISIDSIGLLPISRTNEYRYIAYTAVTTNSCTTGIPITSIGWPLTAMPRGIKLQKKNEIGSGTCEQYSKNEKRKGYKFNSIRVGNQVRKKELRWVML